MNTQTSKSPLLGKRIVILINDGVDRNEVLAASEAINQRGGQLDFVAPDEGFISSTIRGSRSVPFCAISLDGVKVQNVNGLVLPGETNSSFTEDARAIEFIREFFKLAKPVAAIGSGVRYLISADVVHDRRMTSPPELRSLVESAGGMWTDAPCVCDQGLVTAQGRDALQAFCRKAMEEFAEGTHVGQTV